MQLLKKLSPALSIILAGALTYVAVFAMMAASISPKRYDLEAGGVSRITITATKDVEDSLTTSKLRDIAERQVSPSYVSDDAVQPAVMAALQQRFTQLLQYRARTQPVLSDAQVTDGQRLEAQGVLSSTAANTQTLDALCRIQGETLSQLYERTYALVRETLSGKLPEGQEVEAIQKIGRDLMADGFTASDTLLATALIEDTLRPNMLLDEETTQLNREKAVGEVEPIVYKKGQNIIRAGEVVTASQIEMLNSLGMLKDRHVDLTLYLGLGALLALLAIVLLAYMQAFPSSATREPHMIALLMMIMVGTLALCMLTRALNPYLMPVAAGAMLTTLLMKPRLAIVVNLILAVLTGLLASTDSGAFTALSIMFMSLVSGTLAVPLLKRKPQRLNILLTGVALSALNALITLAVGLINSASQAVVMSMAIWAAGSGLLSAVLCLGLQPALEYLFNLVTPSKLMELSNPNQPLLRRLLLEAPGTYHHSILVANLAEAAADAVGANGLLARVGAYYHDIGKLKRPMYFKENQMSDNPHDRTDPRVSTAILTAHPRDGVEMGQKARLPQEVLDIIGQHHGDTPVLYFYDRAVKQGGPVDLNDFRYGGPRPHTKEAAIVMLSDTVEAAARAAAESSSDKIRLMIRHLVRSKTEDGQLDECDLTHADLTKACEAFVTVLNGVYHERVEYPNVALPERLLEHKLDVKPEHRHEARLDGKAPTKPEGKPEVKPEARSEVKPEVRPEVKPEVKPEPKPEVKLEPKPEVKPEPKPEVKSEVNPEQRPEVKSEVKPEAKSEARPSVKPAATQEVPHVD
ncbi:MAG: HDIG domain-containing protein [Clostridia bacterium]